MSAATQKLILETALTSYLILSLAPKRNYQGDTLAREALPSWGIKK